MIGETFGSYRVTDKIGEGGMGAVYLAEHTLIGRKVAVKVLLPEHSRKQDLVDRFFNEARTAAGLNHPALVDVFDFGVHASGSAYLVMDYLDGESLGSRLTRVAPLPTELAVDLGRQIARGMEAAHSKGIVHRDLKPDNIYLVADAENAGREQVKILDFGIAKLLGSPSASKGATSTGMVIGTPLFMAPEQCRGAGAVDHRADIYSLGCILYLMLCARPPFEYAGVGEILAAHLHEAVAPPRTINPSIPEELDAIILKALAKNPDERYQTMAAVAADLARVTAPPAVAGVPLPPTMKLPPAPATTLSKAASSVVTSVPVPVPPPARPRLLVPVAGAFAAGLALSAVALLRPRPTATRSAAPVVTRPLTPIVAADAARQAAAVAQPPLPVPTPVPQTPPPAPVALPPSVPAQPVAIAPAPPRRKGERKAPARDPVDAYARGIANLARGDEREALEWFRTYLRGSGLPAGRRAEAERYTLSLQRKFGEIEVSCEIHGAEISLDGRPVGRAPLTKTLFLAAGPHELLVTTGGETLRRPFRISAGERKPIILRR